MTLESRENEYLEIEQELDIKEFRNSVLDYFSKISDPRLKGNSIYKMEHAFFLFKRS